jgi:hypothetical protein
VLYRLGQLRERAFQVEAVVSGEGLQHLEVELIAAIPSFDRSRGERKLGESDDAARIEEADRAQAVAARTCADRIVERKEPRLELRKREAADRTCELG